MRSHEFGVFQNSKNRKKPLKTGNQMDSFLMLVTRLFDFRGGSETEMATRVPPVASS